MADNNNWEKEKIMRDKFQKELEELNEEIIEMGKMIVLKNRKNRFYDLGLCNAP